MSASITRRIVSPSIAMIGAAGCWGATTAFTKAGLETLDPLALLNLQLLASAGFLWIIVLGTGRRVTFDREVIYKGAAGLLEPGLAYIFVLWGLTHTTASAASLIASTEPLIVFGLLATFCKSRTNPLLLLCAVGALIGVYLSTGSNSDGGGQNGLGNFLVLIGTLIAAIYVVVSSHTVAKDDPLVMAAMQQSWGLACFTVISLVLGERSIQSLNPSSITTAGLTGIFQYGLSFWFYLYAIKHLAVDRAAMLLNLIPIFGICSAWLYLGEQLNALQGIGAILICGSVFTAVRMKG